MLPTLVFVVVVVVGFYTIFLSDFALPFTIPTYIHIFIYDFFISHSTRLSSLHSHFSRFNVMLAAQLLDARFTVP